MAEIIPDMILNGLAAAALESGLRQVLLFDADFTVLEEAVSLLHQLLTFTTSQKVQVVPLTGLAQEDDLWGSYIPVPPKAGETEGSTSLTITWQDGWLTQNHNDNRWLLVVIPDLTRLSLATSRACIALLDTPIAYMERYGQQVPWQPRICWLAACARDEVGKLSPHLLDRFTLRLSAQRRQSASSPTMIMKWLQDPKESVDFFARTIILPDEWRKKVTNNHSLLSVSSAAILRVINYSDDITHIGMRRELALARLGRAMARLAGETVVFPYHIDEAANLMGLTLPQLQAEPTKENLPETEPSLSTPSLQAPSSSGISELDDTPQSDPSYVMESDDPEMISPGPFPPVSPYPEDKSPVDRELFTLQLPLRRQRANSAEHGVIIGTQSADSLQDLALIPTFIEAAFYQRVRRKNYPDKANSFILSATDLRRYRRIPQPEKMLVLLLDYTSLHDCEWQNALTPHLRWAYVSRASITIIQVGSSNVAHELRAQKIAARSLLTPRIAEALETQPGRTTPLAHGLEMAYQVIQQIQQHGRSLIQETRFVIITDGRGNVPLSASSSGQVKMPVNREGIEDALKVAYKFQEMKRLQAFMLDPQPMYHEELPLNLAETLGAQHQIIPLVVEAQI